VQKNNASDWHRYAEAATTGNQPSYELVDVMCCKVTTIVL
jgi:hypothetical protein